MLNYQRVNMVVWDTQAFGAHEETGKLDMKIVAI
jgi:hypothetical protein